MDKIINTLDRRNENRKSGLISRLLLVCTLLCFCAAGQAAQFYQDGIAYFFINETDVVEVRDNHQQTYKGEIVIPAEVTYKSVVYTVNALSYQAFYDCEEVTSVTLPESIIEIGELAFSECSGLTSFIIPEKVEKMGRKAFFKCLNLEKVTIQGSVVGENAFFECPKLTEIHVSRSTPPQLNDSFENYTATLYVPAGSKANYQSAPGWKNFKKIVEE
ncbi:MAG: leucine-rich repeat domain-containing protein [Bacteroidales bacterium]